LFFTYHVGQYNSEVSVVYAKFFTYYKHGNSFVEGNMCYKEEIGKQLHLFHI